MIPRQAKWKFVRNATPGRIEPSADRPMHDLTPQLYTHIAADYNGRSRRCQMILPETAAITSTVVRTHMSLVGQPKRISGPPT